MTPESSNSRPPWNVSYREAIEIQNALQPQVILENLCGEIRYVAGIDVSCAKGSNAVWAGVVVLSYPELAKVEERRALSASGEETGSTVTGDLKLYPYWSFKDGAFSS